MITVACVLKAGGIYDGTWVDRLHRAVVQHMNAEHRFVCLTDDHKNVGPLQPAAGDIHWKPLRHGWPGWWSKMEIYSLPGRVLYLDLDVAVVGPLDALLDAPTEPFDGRSFAPDGTLVAVRDFYRPDQYNTSVMLIEGMGSVLESFAGRAEACMAKWRGDQEMLTDVLPEAYVWADGPVVSYRKHCRARLHKKGRPPPSVPAPAGASVVCFHGAPKMPDATGWPQEYWAA